MTTWITICDTCRTGDDNRADAVRPGEVLARLIEDAAAEVETLRSRRVSCLMGCNHGCNVAIQAAGKVAYSLGRFTPDADAARGIVDYARRHAASANGVVPYRDWPQAVKGHFVARHPPLPPA